MSDPGAEPATGRLVAYVGCYADPDRPGSGGISILGVAPDGGRLDAIGQAAEPGEAGYLVWAPSTRTLYAVDERKNDGRGPVGAQAAVHALSAGPDGSLTWLNSLPAPGPFPTYLDLDLDQYRLVCASHGGFDHVERIVRTADGGWDVGYVYDDSAVLLYELADDGRLARLADVQIMTGHGPDPNESLQAGGHGQASPHAHCAVIDPSRRFVLVADKGTDQIHVYRLGAQLRHVHTVDLPPQTGPRHIAFDPATGHGYLTCEFASDLASFALDADTGEITVLDRVSTLAEPRFNEPADVRVHPEGRIVYVNNRGEDSLAWFGTDDNGRLTRQGHVDLATSIHPGLAARSFAIDPTGAFLLVADRPADLVRAYAIDRGSGALTPLTNITVTQPAFIAITEVQS